MKLNNIIKLVGFIIFIILVVIIGCVIIFILFFKKYGDEIGEIEDKIIVVLKRIDEFSFRVVDISDRVSRAASTITVQILKLEGQILQLLPTMASYIERLKPLIKFIKGVGKITHAIGVKGAEAAGIGAIAGTVFIPIPVVGTIVGAGIGLGIEKAVEWLSSF